MGFSLVIWGNCVILLERGFLDKMVDTDVLLDVVVVEIVVVETVDVMQVWFFDFFQRGCMGDMVGVRVVIVVVETVFAMVVFVW